MRFRNYSFTWGSQLISGDWQIYLQYRRMNQNCKFILPNKAFKEYENFLNDAKVYITKPQQEELRKKYGNQNNIQDFNKHFKRFLEELNLTCDLVAKWEQTIEDRKPKSLEKYLHTNFNLKPKPIKKEPPFVKVLDEIIWKMEFGGIEKYAGERFANNTAKKYRTFLNHFKAFEEQKKHEHKPSEINHQTVNDFITYLQNKSNSNGQSNTLKMVKTLKGIVTKINNHTDYNIEINYELVNRIKIVLPDNAYLKKDELTRIEELELNEGSTLRKVRDFFVLLCYLGQNYIDVYEINRSKIKTDSHGRLLWFLERKKSESIAKIYIPPKASNILEFYDYQVGFFKLQTVNRNLKKIGKLAKIDSIWRGVQNGSIIEKKKYELISTHTGRRTYITNLFYERVPLSYIMMASGHKSLKSLERYLKIDEKEMMDVLTNVEYLT